MDCFDPLTGQVYRERVIRAPLKKPTTRQRVYRSRRGAGSLTDAALRYLVHNASSLELDTLRHTPQPYIAMIWKAICAQRQESLEEWKMLVTASDAEAASGSHKSHHCLHLPRPLVDSLGSIHSLDMTWLVNLELHMYDELYTNMDFRTIAELSNLETLVIRYGHSTKHGFDDSVMEHLALRAAHEGKLQRLRAVIVQNSEAFSSAVFSFLQKFKCLDSVCVLNTSIKAKDRAAKDFGWKRLKSHDQIFCPFERNGLPCDYEGNTELLFSTLLKPYIRRRRPKHQSKTPLLECVFGSPFNSMYDKEISGNELVFERDWMIAPRLQSKQIPVEIKGSTLDSERPAKKMKLAPKIRERGTGLDFGDVLDGL